MSSGLLVAGMGMGPLPTMGLGTGFTGIVALQGAFVVLADGVVTEILLTDTTDLTLSTFTRVIAGVSPDDLALIQPLLDSGLVSETGMVNVAVLETMLQNVAETSAATSDAGTNTLSLGDSSTNVIDDEMNNQVQAVLMDQAVTVVVLSEEVAVGS